MKNKKATKKYKKGGKNSCWTGYKRVPGTKRGAKGSCKNKKK